MSREKKDNPLRAEKKRKLQNLRELNINPYPYKYERTGLATEIQVKHASLEDGEKKPEAVFKVAGRVMTKRPMGKAAFFNIQDTTGKMQIYLKKEEISEEEKAVFSNMDIGDIVGVEGYAFKTKKGEVSIHTQKLEMLCKSIEPLPEKFHGLADIELKYRHRHLDLIMDSESRKVFETRAKILKEIRAYLDSQGFLEVETPMLQPIYGGAAAKPFATHHNALDMQLFMKISPETYLKRLIVGGMEKVYDMNRNFRNEGIDRTHNPEFTMIEWYEAYTDYFDQMERVETLMESLAVKLKGSSKFEYQGKELDFTTPWRRLSMVDAIKEYGEMDVEAMSDEEIFSACKKNGTSLEKAGRRGEMISELFELVAEEKLWNPTFITDYPVDISPLTKMHREKKDYVERFELFIGGMELANSYSELNDPIDQYERLKDQEAQRVVNEEAQPMDEDFMHAIDVGMPPTGGLGLGIERVVMLLTDRPSIRDIILFPTLRPQA
ncbi:MAG: lysine--tRNA ligase [Bdellovibrionota bacterium]|nr:lysine--tRNA ligase [Bdellovibrionota bacterium]